MIPIPGYPPVTSSVATKIDLLAVSDVLMYSLARVSQLIDFVSWILACARVKTGDVGLFPLLIV